MKLAVVGLDSADWTLLDGWLHHLPNIATIRREGASGQLTSCIPPVTIPAWKCYSTGKNPGKLGLYWFAHPDFRTRRLDVNFPGDIGGNLWDYIPNALVINTPGTYPPRTIDGVMVVGFPYPDGRPMATPEWALQQLRGYRVNARTDPRDPTFPEEAIELITSRFSAFRRFARRFEFGQVTIFYIDELHHLYGADSLVLEAWQVIDQEIGRIMEMSDNVVLVSDHGSGPLRHFSNVVPALRAVDAFRVRDIPWSRRSSVLSKLTRGLPSTWLRYGERFVPPKVRDAALSRLQPMEEWLPGEADKFRLRVDWSSLIVPLNQGLMFRNPYPRRRSPSMSDVRDSLEDIEGVRRVWHRDELYSGQYISSAPELWVETEPDVELVARMDEEWETKSPEKGREWIVNHRQEGIYAFYGKDVEPRQLGTASIYDMCPTILSFFNIPPPPGVDGTSLPVARGVTRKPGESRPRGTT